MSLPLTGKVVVVTGAFGILGAATARAAARAGARLVLIDRVPFAPAGLVADCGADTKECGGIDLTVPEDAARCLRVAYDQYQGLDVLVNIAGMFRWQAVADGDSATWDLLYAVNVKTAVNCARAALAYLPRTGGGRIINIGALSAIKSGAGMGAYAASKSGIHRLTESLAEEVKHHGITVNAVLPSIIDTPVNRNDMPGADFAKWVTPEMLAKVIVFLASEDAQDVTGALLPVTGRG